MSKQKSAGPGRDTVVFVGTGPGDPGLMTVRAVDALAHAALVVAEPHVPSEVLERFVSATATLIFDPDLGATPAVRGRRLAELASEHGHVVRLLCDDGVLFAPSADEAAAVHKAGVAFEIIPGVGLSAGVSAYTGTPLTTSSVRGVRFLKASGTNHLDMVPHQTTGHVLTGSIAEITEATTGLLENGWASDTEVVLCIDGTTPIQVTVDATLGTLIGHLRELDDRHEVPVDRATVLLGPGVDARHTLDWFEENPLFGWKVVVPRTKEQSSDTALSLEALGAVPIVVPTISVEPPRTPQQMERAVKGMVTGDYEWVGFTSVNAVRAVRNQFDRFGLDARSFAGLKIAAVGGVTAAALRDWGLEPDLVPETEQSAQGLLENWPPYDKDLDPINRVLLPRADIATDTLIAGLHELDWEVDDVTAYRTVRASPPPAPIRESLKSGDFDAVLFTSSSTVRNLVGIAGKPHASTVIACIGPATAKSAEDLGLRVDVLADEANLQSLVDGLAHFARSRRDRAQEAGETPLRPSQQQARRKSR